MHLQHSPGQPGNHNAVQKIAWDFLVALEASRREEPSRPILFVVHSLGGIVLKELLWRSSTCRRAQAHLKDVYDSTTGIIFFGTPHGEADPRHTAQLVMKAMGYTINEQTVGLLPSPERLRELRDAFVPMAHSQHWTIHSFQEQPDGEALNGHKVYKPLQLLSHFWLY
jgi:hypothetical protein